MTLPAGITTCEVTFGGRALGSLGSDAKVVGRVKLDRPIVWAATGDVFFPEADFVDDSDQPTTVRFLVPHVDQPGFTDTRGNALTMFSYRLIAEIYFASNRSVTIERAFQPLTGQDSIDLDLVPDGPVLPGVSAPQAAVWSVAGHTGVIDVEELREALDLAEGGAPEELIDAVLAALVPPINLSAVVANALT